MPLVQATSRVVVCTGKRRLVVLGHGFKRGELAYEKSSEGSHNHARKATHRLSRRTILGADARFQKKVGAAITNNVKAKSRRAHELVGQSQQHISQLYPISYKQHNSFWP